MTNIKSLLAAALGLFLTACAHPITITPAAAPAGLAVSKSSMGVTYVVNPIDRAREVITPGGGGDKISYFPYRDLDPSIYQVLTDLVAKVQQAGTSDEASKLAGTDFVLIPTITTTSSSPSMLTWPPTDFSVTISSRLLDAKGAQVWEGSVTGNGHAEFDEFKSDFALAARKASADALSKFQAQMRAVPALKIGSNTN